MLYHVVSCCIRVFSTRLLASGRFGSLAAREVWEHQEEYWYSAGCFLCQPGGISSFQCSMTVSPIISSCLFNICCSPQTAKQYAIILIHTLSPRVFQEFSIRDKHEDQRLLWPPIMCTTSRAQSGVPDIRLAHWWHFHESWWPWWLVDLYSIRIVRRW